MPKGQSPSDIRSTTEHVAVRTQQQADEMARGMKSAGVEGVVSADPETGTVRFTPTPTPNSERR